MRTKGYKIKKKDRVITQCTKCNKPYSFDKNKGWPFGNICRECVKKGNYCYPVYVTYLDDIVPKFTDKLILALEEEDLK